ncbi:hypothetical protein U1Q18_052262 [Sarracenia purpurea var. burkii]
MARYVYCYEKRPLPVATAAAGTGRQTATGAAPPEHQDARGVPPKEADLRAHRRTQGRPAAQYRCLLCDMQTGASLQCGTPLPRRPGRRGCGDHTGIAHFLRHLLKCHRDEQHFVFDDDDNAPVGLRCPLEDCQVEFLGEDPDKSDLHAACVAYALHVHYTHRAEGQPAPVYLCDKCPGLFFSNALDVQHHRAHPRTKHCLSSSSKPSQGTEEPVVLTEHG